MSEYIFDSTGGCARCDAMEEEHKHYPKRPHPYCNCKMYPKKHKHCYELGEVTYDCEIDVNFEKDEVIIDFEISLEMPITCLKTGEVHEFSTQYYKDTITTYKEYYKNDDQVCHDIAEAYLYESVDDFIWGAKDACNCK